jgi:hypothetical protein
MHEEDEEQEPANKRRHYLGKLRRSAALEHCTRSALELNAFAPMQ